VTFQVLHRNPDRTRVENIIEKRSIAASGFVMLQPSQKCIAPFMSSRNDIGLEIGIRTIGRMCAETVAKGNGYISAARCL
jgi:hypothetical protein